MDVFVYGTLTEPARVRDLLDSFAFVGAATLSGLRVVEGRYPTLAPPTGDGSVADDPAVGGRLLRVDEDGLAALDEYEGVADDLYVRVPVPLFDAEGERDGAVATYVGDPTRLGAEATWPGSGPFPDRVRRYLSTHDVRVRLRPEG
ncbi:gamma-glutamylcyclotransferase [Halobaculum sp. CBA1158]|uniref:gamma-glutamylcyclotransferase family protein n=1 Tax=Halobaculum sp. CBA1158 TaxID=2904243 RepID=UPI001F29F16A|nr:gamma-glutamylcyclotransferase family protein [Halobaculum sp. CBA1158]UIP00511.1 gamma-glutamylcyclotransferase [Halobaculum sp. CBA1158]